MTSRARLLLDGRALRSAAELFEAGMHRRRASFELSFATAPQHVGFLVVAGVEPLVEAIGTARIDEADVRAARAVFRMDDAFVDELVGRPLRVDVNAVPEGTAVFPRTPVVHVEGSLLDVVLLAPLVASSVERASSVATTMARVVTAADGDSVVEAASARESNQESALEVARAAYVGGAVATTNPIAAAALRMPYQPAPFPPASAVVPRRSEPGDGWGGLPEEVFVDLDGSEDEEAELLEAKRRHVSCSRWIVRRLTARALTARLHLVAIEENGAWRPHQTAVKGFPPGRKILVRYHDREGRAVADVVHLHNERMMPEPSLGASRLAPLARARVRAGRLLEKGEPAAEGHARLLAARRALPVDVLHLRDPADFTVRFSDGVRALATSIPG